MDPNRPAFLDPLAPKIAPGLTALVLLNLAVGAAYAVTGYAGLQLAFVAHAATLFWPPSGIAFAALWLGGPRLAPAVLLAAFGLNLEVFGSPYPAVMVAVGNILPGLAARTALRRILTRFEGMGELPTVLAFILVACLGATVLSASVGALVVHLAAPSDPAVSSTWVIWWMGDAMGVLIAAPPLLLARRLLTQRPDLKGAAEAALFALLALITVAGLLLIRKPLWALELCKLSTFLLSLWAGARFGLLGPAAVTVVMAVGSVVATSLAVGPFAQGDFYDRFVLVHAYLFAEAAAGLLFAAALEDLKIAVRRERTARNAIQKAYSDRIALLNMLNHDVRTPLSGIMGVLQGLALTPLSPEQRQSIALGLRAGSSLTTLVNDLLDVTRVDAGRMRLGSAPFSPDECLRDLVDLARPSAEAKSLAMRLEIREPLPEAVLGDRTRLEQILGNLLTNAIAYTHAGEVRLQACWDAANSALIIDVMDTGPGLPGGLTPSAFNRQPPFTDPLSSGLGLGLHICSRLVDLMGGAVTYEGGPGRGSHFHLTLPFDRAPHLIDKSAFGEAQAALRSKILLVEDDEIAREASKAFLESLGHRVIAAGDGSGALELARETRLDLIIMDMHLGSSDASGVDLVQSVRAMPAPAGAVPLVALTGDDDPELAARLKAAGADEVWIKPLDLTRIVRLLKDCQKPRVAPARAPAAGIE